MLGKCWSCPFMLDLLLIKGIWRLLILLGAHLKLPDTARARIFGKVQNLKDFCRNLRVQGPFQYFIEDFLGTVLIKFDWSLSFLQKLIVLWIFYIEVAFFHIIILICFHLPRAFELRQAVYAFFFHTLLFIFLFLSFLLPNIAPFCLSPILY